MPNSVNKVSSIMSRGCMGHALSLRRPEMGRRIRVGDRRRGVGGGK